MGSETCNCGSIRYDDIGYKQMEQKERERERERESDRERERVMLSMLASGKEMLEADNQAATLKVKTI